MIELAAVLNENNSFGENAAQPFITTSGGEYDLHEKALQLIPAFTYVNAPTNQTIACQVITIHRTDIYGDYRLEDTSRSDLSFVSLAEFSSLKEATEIHFSNWHGITRVLRGNLRHSEIRLGNVLLVMPGSPWTSEQVIQEEKETVRADTTRALSFGELVNALDRISRPTEIEDVPLPFDPDDYPVV